MIGRLRWLARLIVFGPLVIAWFFAIGYAVTEPSSDSEGIALVAGLVALTVAAIIAWSREAVGGAVLIGLAFVVAVFAYVTSEPNNLQAGMMFMLPWLVSGVLFLAVHWMARGEVG